MRYAADRGLIHGHEGSCSAEGEKARPYNIARFEVATRDAVTPLRPRSATAYE